MVINLIIFDHFARFSQFNLVFAASRFGISGNHNHIEFEFDSINKIIETMTSTSAYFPDFEFPASELSAYSFSVDFFIISLKSQQIVDHRPDDIEAFRDWLDNANIRDIYADSELDQLMKAF